MADNPLRPLVTGWLGKIKLAMEYKKKYFQDDANECMAFFNGPYDLMYGMKGRFASGGFAFTGEGELPKLGFKMTVNKAAEMVQLFGPVLYHRNPVRQVNPRKPPMVPIELFGDPNDPNVQAQYMPLFMQVQQQRSVDVARSKLLEFYLNYTPNALDLKSNSRDAIDEAIIKGMGCLWSEVYQAPNSQMKMIGSFYDSVDNLAIDADMETIEHAKWVARKCTHPVWEVEREYGLAPGSLKGNLESFNQQAVVANDEDGDYRRKQGLTNDLLVYWKVYSKMGLGARMTGVNPAMRDELDRFGDFCFLVVCDTVHYPLNLPPEVIAGADEQIQQRIQWPTPYWADDDWPFQEIAFHRVPRRVWPMSHLKPGMGELKFINWAYSFIAGKIKTACRDFIAIAKSASEEIKAVILSGTDYELIEIEKAHGTIKEVVEFLQHPPFQGDIWKVIEAVEANFEKRVGLTELMYGQSAQQYRSAAEANVKNSQLSVRPDDMANKVEDAMSGVARKEALACRWHLQGQDVAPIMGPIGAQFWQQLVVPSDPNEILHSLEYRIEAGSAKKPNKERDAANMQAALQVLLPVLQEYMMATGDVTAINQLLADWSKSIDLEGEKYLLKPPPPPPMPAAPGAPQAGPGGPPPGPQQPQQSPQPMAPPPPPAGAAA